MSAEEGGSKRHRVLFPMSFYSENKRDVKKPFKDLELSWQFLGREGGDTKGRYAGEGVQVFARFTERHADFTVWGADDEAVEQILDAWSQMPTLTPEEADVDTEGPASKQEDKAVRVWRFKEPTQRPGEPDALYQRRVEEWKAQDPR